MHGNMDYDHPGGLQASAELHCAVKSQFKRARDLSTKRVIAVINTALIDMTSVESKRFIRITACVSTCPAFSRHKVKQYAMDAGIWCRVSKPRTRITPANITHAKCNKNCAESEYCAYIMLEIPMSRAAYAAARKELE